MDKTTDTNIAADIASGSYQAKNVRKRKEPTWFGDRADFDDSNSMGSPEPSADNSFDDKNYSPEKKRKKPANDDDMMTSTSLSEKLKQFEVIDLNDEFNE